MKLLSLKLRTIFIEMLDINAELATLGREFIWIVGEILTACGLLNVSDRLSLTFCADFSIILFDC